jgi:hypothetical protein
LARRRKIRTLQQPIEHVDAVWIEDAIAGEPKPLTLKTLRRTPRRDRVRLNQLKVAPYQEDPTFMALYLSFLDGERSVGVTRLDRGLIQAGFRRPGDRGIRIDDVRPDHLQLVRTQIRAGSRPQLWVYRSTHKDDKLYTCSDDVVTYTAYTAEGIAFVPCYVFDPDPATLQHAAFRSRVLPQAPDRPIAITDIVLPAQPKIARILGDDVENCTIDAGDGIVRLEAQLLLALRHLRRYHTRHAATTHYHHSLASAVARASRLVEALRRIQIGSLPDASAVIVRAIYELWLSVYLDWLAPELVGPVFKIHGMSTRAQRRGAMPIVLDNMRAHGWSTSDAEAYNAGRARLFRLVESAAERATMNPGASLHGEIYPRLCSYTHQDFAAGSPFLVALSGRESPTRLRFDEEAREARFLLQVLDIAIGGITWCIFSDTGG